ncbi:hypothetical protein SAMN05446935_2503 [Burkholderia sp. YR290]|nr:hypothetical protein SAMN05446935_2503 [Burkholderia sp. YR290]
MRHRKPARVDPGETSEELVARLRAFALATRDEALRRAKIAVPEHISVLAGPLRKRVDHDR